MIDKKQLFEKVNILYDIAMEYEAAVLPLFEKDYITEFRDFYKVCGHDVKLVPSEEDLDGSLRIFNGEYRWEAIAGKTKSLFGLPSRILLLDENASSDLKEALGGPRGLAPFYFVFDLMFCEYENYTLCFICGTNN